MRSSGNGSPELCAANLLQIIRGEVPYDRLKGIDGGLIDSPSSTVSSQLEADATWVLETYEPRVNIESINLKTTLMAGHYQIQADILTKGGTS